MTAPYGQDHPGTPPRKRRRNRIWWLSALWFVLLYAAYHAILIAGNVYWDRVLTSGLMGGFFFMGLFTAIAHMAGLAALTVKAFRTLRDETRWDE